MADRDRPLFLFSVDLEDVRDRIPAGHRYAERVPAMTEKYLRFLSDLKAKATFFAVGQTARRYPALIGAIAAEGHEIACHSDKHVTLDRLTKDAFRADTQNNLESLYHCGCRKIDGFRAPAFSLTEKTQWAHEVLAELGFSYSSSVLPARNPLFGWEGFGQGIRRMGAGIWELPMTLTSLPFVAVPFAGGVYFRALPYAIIKRAFARQFAGRKPVLSYFHPYDIDTEQERFMHPEIDDSRLYNFLLYYNRAGVLTRLGRIVRDFAATIIPYREYLGRYRNEENPTAKRP